jgi:hypothetical protein
VVVRLVDAVVREAAGQANCAAGCTFLEAVAQRFAVACRAR